MKNRDGYIEHQGAAAHGTRRFNAVAVYRRAEGTSEQALQEAVGKLLSAVEAIELDTLDVLVGIGWSALAGHAAQKELAERHPKIEKLLEPLKPGAKLRVATPGDVIVQVAAELETDRLFALRLAAALLAPAAVLVEESLGVRRGVGREPFGYRGVPKSERESYSQSSVVAPPLIESGAAAGGGWLLYQRLAQDVTQFLALSDARRDEVVGVSQEGDELSGGPGPRSHVGIARAYQSDDKVRLARRGFPYREKGEEGLCFLALAAAPESFGVALDAMSAAGGGDALLAYIEARAGGLYFVPPSAEWLVPGVVQPVELPAAAKELERKAQLILAEVTPAALEYVMTARALGAFKGTLGREEIASELRPIVAAVNWLIAQQKAGSSPTTYDDLTALLAKALAQANAANLEAGEYITFDP